MMTKSDVVGSASRPGPEADLVSEFVTSFKSLQSSDLQTTVLIEPAIAGCRPDIVVVDWDPIAASGWPELRQRLTTADLQLMHLAYQYDNPGLALLSELFRQGIKASVRRLSAADLISVHRGILLVKPIEQVFFVKRILAFEAKISSVSRAIQQAFRNTWFSSESYVLTQAKNPRTETLQQIRSAGIGLWLVASEAARSPIVDAPVRTLPLSYGSWHINEKLWKHYFLN